MDALSPTEALRSRAAAKRDFRRDCAIKEQVDAKRGRLGSRTRKYGVVSYKNGERIGSGREWNVDAGRGTLQSIVHGIDVDLVVADAESGFVGHARIDDGCDARREAVARPYVADRHDWKAGTQDE